MKSRISHPYDGSGVGDWIAERVCQSFSYPLSHENNLASYIAGGYYIQAENALGQIFSYIADFSPDEKLIVLSGLALRLLKIVFENAQIPFDERSALMYNLAGILDAEPEQCKVVITDAVHTLCLHRQPLADKFPPLVIKTQKAVKRYYNNPNLSIAMIGEKLGVCGYYASKRFKKCTGEALSDYICRVRVERAKWLMTDSSLTLSSIAARVGFGNARSLNIAFKKVEGMAPSVARSLCRDI
ncbi:MAG: helix-turn-helix transcriptional regulator [Clostridia bacterium]|nr:helix-turn-helix transcriptional regulator [Clostridia bacterium]